MKLSILTAALRRVCVVLSLLALIPGETRAGQAPVEGGNAPVTQQVQKNEPFQPVLKGPTLEEQNLKTAEYLFLRGRILEAENKERQALQCYERACQFVSSDAVLICLVQLAMQQKRYDEAICYFDKIQNPSALGIPALDQLATICLRMADNSRVVKTYRAILSAIPVGESGPLRMLVHERLGIAEYSAGNYDEALVSLKAIHTMLKAPARYGINEEDAQIFEDGREMNLLILLDVHLIKRHAAEARAILDELKAFKEKSFEESDLPKDKIDAQKKEWELEFLFLSARLALVESKPAEAKRLALKAYSQGFIDEETPYLLLEQILEVENQKDALMGTLETLFQEVSDSPVLKARLAELYLQKLTDSPDENERRAYAGKSLKLLNELQDETLVPILQIQFMYLAVLRNDQKLFMKAADTLMKEFGSGDSVTEILQNLQELLEKGGKSESETSAEARAEAGEDAKAEAETEDESKAREEDESPFVLQEGGPLWNFARDLVQFADKRFEEKPDLKLPWQTSWVLGVLCRELDSKSEKFLKYYDSASEAIRRKTFTNEQKPGVEAFFNDWGDFFVENDQPERAETNYRRALEIFPDSPGFSLDLVRVLASLGKVDEAQKRIQAERRKDPDYLEAAILESLLFHQIGKNDEACANLRQVLDEVADNYSAEINRKAVLGVKLQLSNLEDIRGNAREAEELLRQALDEFPDNLSAKNSLAYFWACRNENLQQAREYSEETLKESPDESMYQDTLAWVYYRLGEFEKAQELLLKASKDLDDPVVFSHLADVSLALNQKEKAIQYFNQSMKLFQESKQKHRSVDPRDEEHVKTQLKSLQN
ncbi:MAG: tetratricopeptide repeat protein [Thermoguttaceae bacterium]|nr:tetratricopeptide repeat protein [Thermoguttaceae bacterium]